MRKTYRMVNREVFIHHRRPQVVLQLRRVVAVRDKVHARRRPALDLRGQPRVVLEPVRRIDKAASLPGVVGRRAAEDDARALGQVELGRHLEVRRERVDGLVDAVVLGVAHLGARAGAVGPPVVVGEGTAVVVAHFDDHPLGMEGCQCTSPFYPQRLSLWWNLQK